MFRRVRLRSGLNIVGKISDKVIPQLKEIHNRGLVFFFYYYYFKSFEYFKMFHNISLSETKCQSTCKNPGELCWVRTHFIAHELNLSFIGGITFFVKKVLLLKH